MFKVFPRLSVPCKLALVCLAFLIPSLGLMYLFTVTVNGHIDFAEQERRGIEYLRPLEDVLHYLPRHLQLARRGLTGDNRSGEQLSHVQARIDAAIERLAAIDARLGASLQFTEACLSRHGRERCSAEIVTREWKNLKQGLPNLDGEAYEAAHRQLVAKVRTMIAHAGDTSNLILDPDLDATYLMHIALLVVPSMQERLGIITEAGEEYLAENRSLSPAEWDEFKINVNAVREADFKRALTVARSALIEDRFSYGTSDSLQYRLPPTIEKFDAAVKSFIDLATGLVDGTKPAVEPNKYAAAGAEAQLCCFNLWQVTAEELDGLLRTRIEHYRNIRAFGLLLAALAFGATFLLTSFIARSIKLPLERQADELRLANEKIIASEIRTRAIIDAAPDCVITADGDDKIVTFNRAAEGMFGYTREEAVGRTVAELLVPVRYRESHAQGQKRYLQTGDSQVICKKRELEGLRADGSEFPIEITMSVVTHRGRPTSIAFVSDITQRRASDDELYRLYAESRLLLASIPSVLIHLDSDGVIARWNAAAENVFGLSADEAIGQRCQSLPWGDPETAKRIKGFENRFCIEYLPNIVVQRGDGTERILDLTVNPICADGCCTGVLVLGNDRTEQEQLETQLAQAQKLESIGQLAAGLAHEINTPMQFVCDNIAFLSESSAKLFEVVDSYERNLVGRSQKSWEERRREMGEAMERNQFGMIREQVPLAITESLEGAQRVIEIVRAMKEFSHVGQEQKVGVDLNNAVRSTVTISRNRWKYVAELELDLDPDLPTVICVPAEINQVLLNLIVNAGDAIGERVGGDGAETGTITVRTRARDKMILIEVEDTGCGIPEAIRNRIFDPFFTTKDVGKGTGQGLAICYNVVVNKHHGNIEVQSTPGVGSTFRVCLPIVPHDADGYDSNLEPAESLVEPAMA